MHNEANLLQLQPKANKSSISVHEQLLMPAELWQLLL